ncbi:MAG: 23S rRNA (adenine(2503)-C(2))-methyltransferase RlmN [Alphaproteobacteria bacterium]|nr:23S rRNA (adenine(2503)-C(2))-methyltransferase RlmN [Alphaproteobacteria bacterium]MCB9796800.1 23S rRNA (adenine(2503)-C(2))-methyltransferase RlmN [Alphaproteobacteria bacterium]
MARLHRVPDGRVDIRSMTREELQAAMAPLGKGETRANRVFQWLWQREGRSFAEMHDVARPAREALERDYAITELEKVAQLGSEDGTRKFVWRLHDGYHIESVLIPDPGNHISRPRLTLCLSSQVGCAMACSFCLTGDLGLTRNLTPSEIVNQVRQVQAEIGEERVTNLVFMGMGEPLHNLTNLITACRVLLDDRGMNFSHRKITVSTVGLVPQMQKLAAAVPVNLAVSLNATTEAQRRQVMPITKRYSLDTLMQGCRDFPLPAGKRITFEYVMMDGFNCAPEDMQRLAALMETVPAKVNLIPYNENPDRDILRPSDEVVKAFQHHLVTRGIQCSIRTTRGIDISAACGQLGKAAEGMRIPEAMDN